MTMPTDLKLERTVAPLNAPVTLADAKAHLNVMHDEDDLLISSQIDEAVGWCENYTGRAFMPQTWTLFMDSWASSFTVPVAPALSLSIKYDDVNTLDNELPAEQIKADLRSFPVRVYVEHTTEPVLVDGFNSVRCEIVAGWADANAVPSPIKAAILLLLGHIYENREATTSAKIIELPVPFGVRSFLNGFRYNF